MSGFVLRLKIMEPQENNRDGTYSFCAKCPSNGNCCSRVRPGGRIDPPLLFDKDVRQIKRFVEQSAHSFSTPASNHGRGARQMRAGRGGCHFYTEGRCAIYHVRPLDCRLFPLDIIEKLEHKFVWIAYTRFCPIKFDALELLEQAKRLIPQLGDNIVSYARAETPGLDKEPYIELCDVHIPIESRVGPEGCVPRLNHRHIPQDKGVRSPSFLDSLAPSSSALADR